MGISLYKGGGDTTPLNDINFVDESKEKMSCVVAVVGLKCSLQAFLPRLFAKSFFQAFGLNVVVFDDEDIF